MGEFYIYFAIGLEHILDIKGIDHILFVLALCAGFIINEWRRLLFLITAFTIGHSTSLAMSVLQIVEVNAPIIEFLIPVTIFITAISNFFQNKPKTDTSKFRFNYLLAGLFGVIHGLGFSNYLKSLLGRNTSIINQLLAFNLGLELGQIVIVSLFLIFGLLIFKIFKINKRDWTLVISTAIATKAFELIIANIFW